MHTAKVTRIAASAPDDMSGIEAAIEDGRIDPRDIVAVFGKTEGNGLVNDFSRALAVQSLRRTLSERVGEEGAAAVSAVMSGGTEGGIAPHWLVFEKAASQPASARAPGSALAIGRAHTPALPSEDLGRMGQVQMVAEGVADAMRDAGIDDPADVHFVQIKCPLLTAGRIAAVEARGQSVAVRDTLKSMGWSRGASSLGVGVALGEIDLDQVSDAQIMGDPSLWSGRASASAGIELLNHEIVVLGMSTRWSGPLAIDHTVMSDGLDIEPVRSMFFRFGIEETGQLRPAASDRVVALLAKAEASRSGMLRGRRHTMNDDSDVSSTRHARGFVAGALGGLLGHGEIFVSGGAEHQGPDGGGPVAAIVKRDLSEGPVP